VSAGGAGVSQRRLRISHVGLRGVVGNGLTAAHVLEFASAFATFLDTSGPVILGRDPRASGVMLREGVISGLMACGRDVVDLGLASTPVIQHAIRRLGAAGGVSIGASHNSAEWNALKFFGANGTYLSTAEAGELLDIYHLKRFAYARYQDLGRLREQQDAIGEYLKELAAAYDFDTLKRFRVVVDCCNGTSALLLHRLNQDYGFGFILINDRIEGSRFAHEPSTTARTVALQLAPLVVPLKADAGFLFDVDSDRVAIATELGEPVSEELILPLLADHHLPESPGKLVITNLSTTALLKEVAARHGGEVIRVPVGRQAAMDALAIHGMDRIALAGEGTGAVMLARFRFIYDGIASMLSILTMMAARGRPLSEITRAFPRYSMLKGEVPLASPRIPALLMELQREYGDGEANTADGLRVDWPGQWFHIRVSQTEPIVRVICEQRGDPPKELFRTLMDRVRRLG
jgi:phosphomannomutase